MYWKINILFFLLFTACKSENRNVANDQLGADSGYQTPYLIEVDELKTIIDKADVKIIDFRKPAFYQQEHISGALNVWRSDVEDTTYAYEGMMASPAQIENLFSSLGIGNQDLLVIYDDNGLCDAARLWWVLQNYDFTNVKLLNGGLEEWKAKEGVISNEAPTIAKTSFQLTADPSMKYHISKEQLKSMMTDGAVILDTRSAEEYSGVVQKSGAAKGGRIPKSINIDWVNSIDLTKSKKFKSLEELSALYVQFEDHPDSPIVVYCHSGVRSAHTTFVLTQLLGFKNVKNYDGSWVEWSHFDDLAFENDSTKTIIN